MNADGSAPPRLTNNMAGDYGATWSANGAKIAFNSDRNGKHEVYVMNADGSGQTNLTNNAANDYSSAWSPDGMKIAFTSDRDGNSEIYVMNADGSGQTRLTNNTAADAYPDWSPDGTKIAFQTNRDGPGSIGFEVYMMNGDGSGATRLTSPGPDNESPDWSPDGTKITFHSDRDGALEVYVMNADGSGQTNLTSNSFQDYGPDWQPVAPFSPMLADTDADGCTDKREFQTAIGSETSGGRRDHTNFWDYADMPIQEPPASGIYVRDQMVRVNDILAVLARYFTDDDNSTAPVNRNTDPLSNPPGKTGYHPAFDRTYLGPNQWNLGPPNGMIRIDDILAVIYQYFHDCA